MAPISSLTERMVRRVGVFCDEVTDSSKEYSVQYRYKVQDVGERVE